MAPFGAANSPSLRKTEASRQSARPRFSFGRVAGHPFALATLTIALLGWIIAMGGSIPASVKQNDFPNFIWWTLAFTLLNIIGITIAIAADAVHNFHVAITAYLAADMVFCSSAVTFTVYSANLASEVAAAGFILLSIVQCVWIFYFGSEHHSGPHSWVNSFALHRPGASPHASRQMSNRFLDPNTASYNPQSGPQLYHSANLAGFEASSPSGHYGAGGAGMDASQGAGFGTGASTMPANTASYVGESTGPSGLATQRDSSVGPGGEYQYRARAIYSYEANPDDANELSFAKHEILEVSDVSGRWWQAKKSTGETGIAPSNYLILL